MTANDEIDVERTVAAMAEDLRRQLDQRGMTKAAMIGIHTGGVWVARRLHELLDIGTPLGTLNITFYRDDFSRIGMHPQVQPSELPFDIDERHVILVDDVLHTGRTIRAALNEIFDYGRPASVLLAVLVDRSGRELPIQPDVRGVGLELRPGEHVKLAGPEDLSLMVQTDAQR